VGSLHLAAVAPAWCAGCWDRRSTSVRRRRMTARRIGGRQGGDHGRLRAPCPLSPARPGRRSACHRAPYWWRPGCGCPMIT